MDQLILQWLSNREASRHNQAAEAETQRHNLATEKLERMNQLNQSLIASLNRSASIQNTYLQTAATREASLNSRRASEYGARLSSEASRYNTRMNAWNQLQHEITQRHANAITSRYNEGRLVMAANELQETSRANKARESENRASRLQSGYFAEMTQGLNRDIHEYQKERDWVDRGMKQRQYETDMRLQMSKQIVDLLGVGAKAKMFSNLQGGMNNGKTTEQQINDKGSWTSTYEALDAQLRAQGR